MKRLLGPVVAAPLVILFVAPVAHAAPQVCDLSVRADMKSGIVWVVWNGGTPPYVVVRSNQAALSEQSDVRIVESRLTSRALGIPERLSDRYPYRYQVYDASAVPEAISVKPARFKKGQVVALRGFGFAKDCALNRVTVAGLPAEEVSGCSQHGLKFRAPADADASGIAIHGPSGDGGAGDQQRCNGVIRRPQTWRSAATSVR